MRRPRLDDSATTREVLERARTLGDWLVGEAARIEAERRLPPDVAARLTDAGMFRITVPRRFGGFGLGPAEAWRATFEIARGCASSAWLHGLGAANLLMLAKFPARLQAEVFDPASNAIVPMLTGGVGSDIVVEHVPGGIRISGRWRYASGIDVAHWVGLLVTLPAAAGAPARQVVAVVEQPRFAIDHESWQVIGMRGTGSKNVSLDQAFVPEHRWASWDLLQAGGRAPDCPNEEPLYSFPLNTAFAMSVLAPTLGVASATVDEYAAIARERVSSGTREQAIGDKLTHLELANARATVDAAGLALVEDSLRMCAAIATGVAPSLQERAAQRMRIANAARQALAACQSLYAHLGGSLLPAGTRIERQFRDLHAMCSHFLLQPQYIGEAYGRLLLGLELPATARL